MSTGISSLLAFVAVVALIPLVLWLLKRTPIGSGSGSSVMRIVATLPVAPNQRVVTVEVGSGEERRWLVLGVTSSQITTLWTMPPQSEPPAPAQGPHTQFAQLLSRLKKDDGGQRGA